MALYLLFGQHSGELVVERREEGLVPVSPVTMNAFELISTSQGLNLSSLFEKQMVCLTLVVGLGKLENFFFIYLLFIIIIFIFFLNGK